MKAVKESEKKRLSVVRKQKVSLPAKETVKNANTNWKIRIMRLGCLNYIGLI